MTDGGQIKEGHPSERAVLWVRYLELADKTGDMSRVERAIRGLDGRFDVLPDHMFLRLLRLSKHIADSDFAARVLAEVFARDRLDEKLAKECLHWANGTVEHPHALRVKDRLIEKVMPKHRASFALAASIVLEGPEAAYRSARTDFAFTTRPSEAVQLSEAVVETGRTHLAARFLRRAVQRWPTDVALQNSLFRALLGVGDTTGAQSVLSDQARYLSETQRRARQLDILKAEGRNDEAWAHHQALERDDPRYARSFECLRMNVFFGEVADFRKVAYEVMAKHRHHLRATFLGSVVDEMRIYSVANPPDEDRSVTVEDAVCYYHPAAQIVRGLRQGPYQTGAPSTPTRRIFQYWDSANVPELVAEITQTWQSVDGWSYQRFTRAEALKWLGDHFDRRHTRAFRMVRREAEQADFLRLCLLEAEGGIYADADDRLTGCPDALLQGAQGAVFFTEAFGCLCNNVIYAPAGHVVISTARRMACEALLRRDNDKVWLKTGPGLLTRALARCALEGLLEDQSDPTRAVTILPNAALKRHVAPHLKLPYKQTDQNWAHSHAAVPPAIKAAWDRVVEG
ncbi:MAG: glycosyltransferase [Pseudomonadota bacterium]